MSMTLKQARRRARRVRESGSGCSEVGQALLVLDTEVEKLTAAQGWISVDDSLPDDRSSVLACNKRGEIGVSERGNFFYHDVTHWMPLPSAPEVGR